MRAGKPWCVSCGLLAAWSAQGYVARMEAMVDKAAEVQAAAAGAVAEAQQEAAGEEAEEDGGGEAGVAAAETAAAAGAQLREPVVEEAGLPGEGGTWAVVRITQKAEGSIARQGSCPAEVLPA